jgi:hypothetical protein
MLIQIWKKARLALQSPRAEIKRKEPRWEKLEERQMLSGPGVDYALTGFSWYNPSKITYSFPADGTSWDQGYNNLNATLNSQFGNQSWKYLTAKALQTWAASTNMNIVPVADNNADFNSNGSQQSDTRFGDIRIGGYDFGSNTVLAQTYFPPPQGWTAAGDVEFNTGFNWGPTASYDFFSVMLHETGHSFGLNDLINSSSPAVENQVYGGVRSGLQQGDIDGIQAIYGARHPDAYRSVGKGGTPATAIDLTSQIQLQTANVSGVSLSTIGDTEYYTIVAPSGLTNISLAAMAQTSGISSVSPKITVFDASMNPLGSDANPSAYGNDVNVKLNGIKSGQRFIIAVTGATNDVFSVGSYALHLKFDGTKVTPPSTPPPPTTPTPTPPVTLPTTPTPPVTPTPTPTPTPPSTPPPLVIAPTVNLGYVTQTLVTHQTLATKSNVNVYSFVSTRPGRILVATGSTSIQVINQYGQVMGMASSQVTFNATKAGIRYTVIIATSNNAGIKDYTLAIQITPTATVFRRNQVVSPAYQTTGGAINGVGMNASLPPSWGDQRLSVQSLNHIRNRQFRSHWSDHRVAVISASWTKHG